MITYETLVLGGRTEDKREIPLDQVEAIFDRAAEVMARASHSYFVEAHVRGRPLAELKVEMSRSFGLTHRHFTAIRMTVDGKVAGIRESMTLRVKDLAGRIASTEAKIRKWKRQVEAQKKLDKQHRAWRQRCAKAKGAGRKLPGCPKALAGFTLTPSRELRRALRFKIHQKNRRLAMLKAQLASLKDDVAVGRIRLCFGGRKLFKAQHHLAENGFVTAKPTNGTADDSTDAAGHAAWLDAWRSARAGQIFLVGSSDERGGNQSATLMPDSDGTSWLRVRLPPALAAEFGDNVFLHLKAFRRGGGAVESAVAHNETVSWRLTRRSVRRGTILVAQASLERIEAPRQPLFGPRGYGCGAIGLDLNADHVALTRLDRFGNPVETRTVRFDRHGDLKDRSRHQVNATLGDAVAEIVSWALKAELPLVAEKLDFTGKKRELRERGPRYARMLSSFVYARFFKTLENACSDRGATLRRVNPAWTSVIGRIKFASGYGLTVHHAAACAIGRRGMGFSERLARRSHRAEPLPAAPSHQPSGADGIQPPEAEHSQPETVWNHPAEDGNPAPATTAFALPARTRGKHVWSDWGRVGRMLRQAKANTAVGGTRKKPVKRFFHPPRNDGSNRCFRDARRGIIRPVAQTTRKSAPLSRRRSYSGASMMQLIAFL